MRTVRDAAMDCFTTGSDALRGDSRAWPRLRHTCVGSEISEFAILIWPPHARHFSVMFYRTGDLIHVVSQAEHHFHLLPSALDSRKAE